MNSAKFIGTIVTIFPVETFGNFEKRVVWVLDSSGKFPNTYAVEFWQNDVNMMDSYRAGDNVEMSIDVRGNHWKKNGKEGVINTLKCWRVEKVGSTVTSQPSAQQPATQNKPPAQQQTAFQDLDITDDAPF